jgi:group 4 capsule polysaccharide lipoprotein GfcB/YjbF
MSRRHVLAAIAASALVRCGSNPDIDLATLRQLVTRSRQVVSVGRDEAAQIPFASIAVRSDKGPQLLLVLATDTAGDLLWTSAARIALVTRAGRIVKTAGFSDNLAATRFLSDDPLATPNGAVMQSSRIIDLPDAGSYSVPVTSTYSIENIETIEILGTSLRTIPMIETNYCPALNWTFQNRFWRDPDTAFVWRSMQTVSPKGPTLTVEVLRPPAI